MPLQPSKTLHFDSWEKLLKWLPEANESQLTVVFVWTGEQKPPSGDTRRLAEVRSAAFEELVARTRDRLKRYLVQRCQCHDVHLAEDVVQQVFIKLFLRAEQYDPRRSFWGWLYRIAHNEYIDTVRRIRPGSVGVGQTGQAEKEMEQWLEQQVRMSAPPESALLEQERTQKLDAAIASLPRLQRTIVQMKREGISGKDVAQQLGISQAYVSQLYHEAGEILRETLEK